MHSPLVSIIVPIYNMEKYLNQCIESIIYQTYDVLEIILIDDGSTDSSLKICREYERKDDRIKVFSKENGGQGQARNIGYSLSKGDYIIYIDSDDYVESTYVEVLVNSAIKYEADLVQVKEIRFKGKKVKNRIRFKTRKKVIEKYTASEALKQFCYQRKISPAPWGKIIRRNVLEGISFPEKVGYEDLAYTYKVIGKSNYTIIIPDKLYYYRQHNLSTMHMKFSEKKIDRIIIAKEIMSYIHDFYPENIRAGKSRWLLANMQLLMELPFTAQYYGIKRDIQKNIREIRCEVLRDKESKLFFRLMALCGFLDINIIMVLGRIYRKMAFR